MTNTSKIFLKMHCYENYQKFENVFMILAKDRDMIKASKLATQFLYHQQDLLDLMFIQFTFIHLMIF